MPGYKGHLMGGCAAFGVTLSLLALVCPKLLLCEQTLLGFVVHALFGPKVFIPLETFRYSLLQILLVRSEWFFSALAGSLFPDIDIKSKAQQWLYATLFISLISMVCFNYLKSAATLSTIAMLPLIVKHRGLFHRVWFVVCAPLLLWWWISIQVPPVSKILLLNTLFFVAGAVSHLWLDFGFKKMIRYKFM